MSVVQPLVMMYGGTFDPVHHGHLRTAVELTQALPVKRLHMIPCQLPPHRGQPGATPEDRMNLLQLAVAREPQLFADDRELRRSGPSWSVDTLISLREDYGSKQPLALVLGWDAFLGLPSWSRFSELLELAHLVVIDRPGEEDSPGQVLQKLLDAKQTREPEDLTLAPAGKLLRLKLPASMEISATRIRQLLSEGRSVRYLLPDAVIDYLFARKLYSCSLSSPTQETLCKSKN
ncbi:nicotinate-nucleotide adenylyltransferase [Marinospirillum perlucidum]|uniref:nicotinate-nucleotide adenylyltransferase n=1 Tax=Marinospirillum perlucidum TaxID=1982602 RepID=UPI000DF12C4C|nr:nicotinate-nucleotide adenylyltransferase [Marinospirillum perlucidum]